MGKRTLINRNTGKEVECCPECKSEIEAWADLDAEVSFRVSKTGKLIKRVITNTFQTDGKSGVRCTNCAWSLHGKDMDEVTHGHFLTLAEKALEQQENIIELSVKRKC